MNPERSLYLNTTSRKVRFLAHRAAPIGISSEIPRHKIEYPDPNVDRQLLYGVQSSSNESAEGDSPTPELSENPSIKDKEK